MQRVLVLESQTPFVRGGAEILVRELVSALRAHGVEADLVSIPFRDSPREELLAHATAWRLIDVSRALERPCTRRRRRNEDVVEAVAENEDTLRKSVLA